MAKPTRSTARPFPAWALGLLLADACIVVYARALSYATVNYDDPEYVSENARVLAGITREGIRWAFTTTYQANWHPVTWLSLMVDATLAGGRPGMFHFTNLTLHVANTLLLFLLLERATRARLASAFVAACFAVHPLHVESVVWIAERKDVLSTFFGFLTLLAWLRFVAKPGAGRYALALLLFALSLLAKPMLVTLPFLLLLLDFWPLRRFAQGGNGARPGASIARLVVEKLPLLALSLASSAVTVYAQHDGGALGTFEAYSLPTRLANAAVSYLAYLGSTLVPRGLAPLYPHPGSSLATARVALSVLTLSTVTAGAFLVRAKRPHLLVGWLWYLVALVPVIGIVQVGVQARADRYTYVPLVGIFLAVAWEAPSLAARLGAPASRLLPAVALLSLAWLAVLARAQVRYWGDTVLLFERTIAVTGPNSVAQNNLGSAYYGRAGPGDIERAEAHYAEAVRIDPRYAVALNNLAGTLMRLGRTSEAIERWNEALRVKPDYVAALCNSAGALMKKGSVDAGVARCEEALRVDPAAACAHFNLAIALMNRGALDPAAFHFESALASEPRRVDALLSLGTLRARQGRIDEAITRFEEVLRIEPTNEAALHNLSLARGGARSNGG